MPMNFPDMNSLTRAAETHGFRAPRDGETERDYRDALADHVTPIDFIESQEIRTGRGWDKWDDTDKIDMIMRKLSESRNVRKEKR